MRESIGAAMVAVFGAIGVVIAGGDASGTKAGGRPRGLLALGVFLFFGATMAFLAGSSLLWRGTPLDGMWRLNPRAFRELAPHATLAGTGFVVLACVLAAAGVGWLRRREWGWWLAVAIIGTQVIANAVNVAIGRIAEGAFGFVIAGALLIYLLRMPVRREFLRSAK